MARRKFESLIGERAARRPLQHLTGTVEFFGLTLAVGPEALLPRPDTETLVEAALSRFDPRASDPLRIADVGCGTGAIALALASRLPAARILALDISEPALALAARNIRRTGFGDRVRIARGDLLSAVRSGTLDAVAANLPYLPEAEIGNLEPEVRDHEPHCALAGGADGLAPLRRLAPAAARVLRPGGEILIEIGAGQRARATAILEAAGFRPVEPFPDLAGIPRVLAAPAGAPGMSRPRARQIRSAPAPLTRPMANERDGRAGAAGVGARILRMPRNLASRRTCRT